MTRLIVLLLFITITTTAHAGWTGPKTVITGKWGTADSEFGFKAGYNVDKIPIIHTTFKDGKILLFDRGQVKHKLYSADGKLIKKLPYLGWRGIEVSKDSVFAFRFDKATKASHVGVYNISSNKWLWYDNAIEVGSSFNSKITKSGDNLVVWDHVNGHTYSPSGKRIATESILPLAFGVKSSRRIVDRDERFDTSIKYNDITYNMVLDGSWDDFVRDQNDYLYFYDSYTTHDPVGDDTTLAWFVAKFDPCGNRIAKLMMPVSEYEPLASEQEEMPVSIRNKVRNEYGPPVIGPDGSVYAYKRTPVTYSILKWTWVDEPSDPKSDCPK